MQQEKSTYYDVQLSRQPTKNEKKKPSINEGSDLISAENTNLSNPSSGTVSQAESTDSRSKPLANGLTRSQPTLSQGNNTMGPQGPWNGAIAKASPPMLWALEGDLNSSVRSATGSNWSPTNSNPGPIFSPQKPKDQRERVQQVPEMNSNSMSPKSSALTSAVEMAMSNVDRALFDMQNKEIERLRAKLESAEREVQRLKDELAKEELRRRDTDEQYQTLEKKFRSLQISYNPATGSNSGTQDIRDLTTQVEVLKHEKQMEIFKRMEVKSSFWHSFII